MTLRRSLPALALALALAAAPLAASGPTGGFGDSDRPHTVTVTRMLEVVEVLDDYRLRVKDAEDAQASARVLQLAEDTRIRAQDKKAFDGRKKLSFEDLAAGFTLSVRMEADSEEILEVKVLKIVKDERRG